MKKKRRTNTDGCFADYVLKGFLPVLLALLLAGGGVSSAAGKLLRVSAAMTSLFDAVSILKKVSSADSDIKSGAFLQNGVSDSLAASSTVSSKIPSDILKLINEAERKYAESSNDGQIIEADYSQKNATAEYDGIYLRNTTKTRSVNIGEMLGKKVYADNISGEPAVLIYHTHTSETYELLDRGFYTKERDSRSSDSAENMIRVGEEMCRVLEENGFKTIHDKTVYDEQYVGAYDRSRGNVSRILKDNPSVCVVLDIHRDSIYQKDGARIKPVAAVDGEKAAQIMLISGCEEGPITDFPNWEKNLAFALNLQNRLSKDCPSLMRPLMFCSRKYNMDLMPCALSVEIGSDANTLSEAVISARLFADSLSEFLKEYKTNE